MINKQLKTPSIMNMQNVYMVTTNKAPASTNDESTFHYV